MPKRTLSEMQEKKDMIEEIKRLNIELKDYKDNYEPKIIFREINQNNKALVALELVLPPRETTDLVTFEAEVVELLLVE